VIYLAIVGPIDTWGNAFLTGPDPPRVRGRADLSRASRDRRWKYYYKGIQTHETQVQIAIPPANESVDVSGNHKTLSLGVVERKSLECRSFEVFCGPFALVCNRRRGRSARTRSQPRADACRVNGSRA